MRIVFICAAFYPSIGGVETHVLALSRELIKRGHNITVLTESKSEYWHSKETSDNEATKLKSVEESRHFVHSKLDQIDIYYFKFGQPSFFKKFRIWSSLLLNYKLIKSADVVHCHDVFVWYLPFRFLLIQKKVFTTFHGYEGRFPPIEKSIWIRKISERLSYGNICVGDFIKRWYGTKPDFVVYGGVSVVKNSELTIRNNESKSRIKIVLIGRLAKDIGVQIYADSLKRLKRDAFKFDFKACGEGELRHELEKYGEVLGFVKKTKEYIEKGDLIFASSYLTMLSIMQLGKPIFAVYTNPLKHDYLFSSPFAKHIYIYSSGKELARGIKNYKPNLRRLKAAQNFANSQTWAKLADTYEELWAKK